MKIKLEKLSCVITNAVYLKVPAPLTTGLCSSEISSINKLPSQPVSTNKTFSTESFFLTSILHL